jgi:hypothetical protein
METSIAESKTPQSAALWNQQYSSPGYFKQFGDNRPAAQKLFKLAARKLKK